MSWLRWGVVVAAMALVGFGINYTKRAIALVAEGDPRAAVQVLREGVADGDEDSEKLLAALLEEGRPSKISGHELAADPAEAFRIYEKIAATGNKSAMIRLGILYATGRGVVHDPRKAIDMFRRSGTLDNAASSEPGNESLYAWNIAYARDVAARVRRYPRLDRRQRQPGMVTFNVDAANGAVKIVSSTAPDYLTEYVLEAAKKALALVPPPSDVVASRFVAQHQVSFEP